jgi:toxin-antitoxin system PIN domain toxin
MILPDINLLVYAYDQSSRQHDQARKWWEERLNGSQMIALSWLGLLGFIRILTSRRIYETPYTPSEILTIVKTWLDQPQVRIVHPSDRHFARLAAMIEQVGTAGNLTTDAHLAALAIERGLVLQTTDADFARFAGLKWSNPLLKR